MNKITWKIAVFTSDPYNFYNFEYFHFATVHMEVINVFNENYKFVFISDENHELWVVRQSLSAVTLQVTATTAVLGCVRV